MIDTIPIRDRNAPRLSFGQGRYVRQCIGTTYEWVTQSGTHLAYVEAVEVIYHPTLVEQFYSKVNL